MALNQQAQPVLSRIGADKEENVIFGGRLGEYRYYDMDATVASVLAMCKQELKI